MPVMDGFEATKNIRTLFSQGFLQKRPYIVALTAYDQDSFKTKAIESGMDHFLTKPVNTKEIKKLLSSLG